MIDLLQMPENKTHNWQHLLFGDQDMLFAGEILVRTLVMYLVILIGLRIMGKRGVRQLSVFELVVVIGLGSAAGDPMFYQEVGLLTAILVFLVVIAAYRTTTWLTAKSKKFEELVEGKTVCLIDQGKFCFNSFDNEDLAQDEFFSELRIKGVSQLGQVEKSYLETSGELSVFFYPDEEVRPGLPLLLHEFAEQYTVIPENGRYACAYCADTQTLERNRQQVCSICKKEKWVKTSDRKRIT